VDDHDWLAERFEAHRTHLRAVAYRMLGSLSDADDAVQETWLRLHHVLERFAGQCCSATALSCSSASLISARSKRAGS
jgi:DNA-directed RNA polymerase specialized sigma24 family protein